MIIECPSCSTRYNIRADLPPEGRPVRCAKCGNVWRATAIEEIFDPEPAAPDEQEHAGEQSAREAFAGSGLPSGVYGPSGDGPVAEDAAEDATASGQDTGDEDQPGSGPDAAEEETAPASRWSWQARMPGMAAPQPVEPEAAPEPDETESGPDASAPPVPQGALEPPAPVFAAPPDEPPAPDLADHGGKVRWFGVFRRGRNGAQDASEPAAAPANTIPFPNIQAAASGQTGLTDNESFQTLEDARAAVRGVFASLGDGLREPRASTHVAPVLNSAPQADQAEERAGQVYWPPRRDADMADGEDGGGAGAYSRWAQTPAADAPEITEDATKPDSAGGEREPALPDRAYMRRPGRADVYGGSPQPGGDTGWQEETAGDLGERLARELQDKWRPASRQQDENPADDEAAARGIADTLWHRPKLPLNGLDPQPADEPEGASEPDPGLADPALEERLAREIEERRLYRPVPEDGADEGRRGGLLAAAAWGLFLCAAAGVGVSFVSFRDAIADALPGSAPLYRALGYPVTVQPLVFEGVKYNWAVSENGRPMLVLKGSIVNQAKRKVPVPLLYVYVMDRDPAANREFRTLIQTGKTRLRRGEKADFSIELLAPRPTITSVELEIRNIR